MLQQIDYSCINQASVPFGVMTGYIIASISTSISQHRTTCWGLLCWRWPFLIEVMLLTPLYLGLYFVPNADLDVCADRRSTVKAAPSPEGRDSNTTVPLSSRNTGCSESSLLLLERKRSPSPTTIKNNAATCSSTGGKSPTGATVGNPFLLDSPSNGRTADSTRDNNQVIDLIILAYAFSFM